MLALIQMAVHLNRGHSIEVSTGMTRAMNDTSKGHLCTCSCGDIWAR